VKLYLLANGPADDPSQVNVKASQLPVVGKLKWWIVRGQTNMQQIRTIGFAATQLQQRRTQHKKTKKTSHSVVKFAFRRLVVNGKKSLFAFPVAAVQLSFSSRLAID
jgi:hypothetical protein